MTEQEWLLCSSLKKRLQTVKKKATERKLRLYAVACYRHGSGGEVDGMAALFDVMERFADGQATLAELEEAYHEIWEGEIRPRPFTIENAYTFADLAWNLSANRKAEASFQDALLSCFFGPLPFRTVPLDQEWLSKNVQSMALTIYEEGRIGDLPILADALEEAGCSNDDILGHCRGPGSHAKGCWVLDLLLQKK